MSEEKQMFQYARDFPSSLQSRKEVIDELISQIWSRSERIVLTQDELTLVIDEAITNAMEHGNHWDESKRVHVNLTLQKGLFLLSVEDEGCGFDYKNPHSEFINGNKLAQRGRGISLMKKFCEPRWEKGGCRIVIPFKTV
jgi:anti-sigma regulatory factor (Ser/Thr protein kinase)